MQEEKLIKTELSQLFQDLAIFYSQKNNIEKIKENIKIAVSLDPNTKNVEIQKLIDRKKMDLQNLYNIIINEPLYELFLLVLILVYSILKNFSKCWCLF